MITLQELCGHLDHLFQPGLYKDYCLNGMQLEGNGHIASIATAVSASLATVEAAVEAGVQALIVHHGLFWKGDSHQICGSKRRKLCLLLDHGITLLAYHLPLDAHQQYGNNWKAARDMGWSELQPFGFYQGMPIGVRGTFAPTSCEQLTAQLEGYYGHRAHVALGGPKHLHSAALMSGGAHKSIDDAVAVGVDCFITGSFDEPIWHKAFEEKINFFAMGHSHSERVGPRALAEHLNKYFDLPCRFLDIENPF